MDKEIPCCQLTGRPDDARKTLIGIAFINDVVILFEEIPVYLKNKKLTIEFYEY